MCLAYFRILIGKAFEQMVFHHRRTVVEYCADIRCCAISAGRQDMPLRGFGFHSPVRGLLLDSIFEYGRIARWFVMDPSRDCRGLANIERRLARDYSSSWWKSRMVLLMTNGVHSQEATKSEVRGGGEDEMRWDEPSNTCPVQYGVYNC
jgi:hypothetical protein